MYLHEVADVNRFINRKDGDPIRWNDENGQWEYGNGDPCGMHPDALRAKDWKIFDGENWHIWERNGLPFDKAKLFYADLIEFNSQGKWPGIGKPRSIPSWTVSLSNHMKRASPSYENVFLDVVVACHIWELIAKSFAAEINKQKDA